MTDSAETKGRPLWLSIEERFLELDLQGLSAETAEAAIQKVAGELDADGYNVSHNGGHMLELRWAMDEMLKVERPFMKDFNDAIAALSFEDVVDTRSAAGRLIEDLGQTWKEIKRSDRKPVVIEHVEKKRRGLFVDKAKGMDGDAGIRFLIQEEFAPEVITSALGVTDEKLAEVNAAIEAERAERVRVLKLLEEVEGQSDEERVKHLFMNEVSDDLIVELAGVEQSVIDEGKKAAQAELEEKQRLAEEEAARKKAEAEGPSLEDIPPDELLEYIEMIRDIMGFSDVEKEIRFLAEQDSIPKSVVDVAVSDPDKLDELEAKAEG
jgi:hypothetical protein